MEGLKKPYSIKEIPHRISDSEVLSYISNRRIGQNHISQLMELSGFPEETIASWFEIDVETFRSYQEENAAIKTDFKEKLIVLISLFKQGIKVFGSAEEFGQWLQGKNLYFDWKPPSIYLTTISGIRFLEARLVGMEYGDNA